MGMIAKVHTEQFRLVNRIASEFTTGKTKLYLMDSYLENMTGSKCPYGGQDLEYFVYLQSKRLPTKEAATLTVFVF